MITPSKTTRRPLKFKTPGELTAELDRLKTGQCKKLGNWSLPQACRHLALVIETNLIPPPSDTPTPEEIAMKEKFFGMVNSPAGMPENLPIGNPALIPPDDCTDAEIDHLKTAMKSLVAYPHQCIKVGRCGPVPTQEVIALHLAHAAHHLSFLEPTVAGPRLKKPAEYRRLRFADSHAALAEIERLQKSPHQCLGNWTLPMIGWHIAKVVAVPLQKPADDNATPEQSAAQGFLDIIIKTGGPPEGMPPPPVEMMPSPACTDADIDAMKTALKELAAYPHSHASMGPMGPVPTEKFRTVHLIHLAHHLGFLVPATNN